MIQLMDLFRLPEINLLCSIIDVSRIIRIYFLALTNF
ncbi:unnamed protein product [Schistosoma curassoni]|uniref:Uncharacterized protein n=1 Tax=Schistosoma curassoni TaxID=6186 RepID=A0A183KWL1_9TREM|nr:unnamed protein product [Schistosoma curassoni]